jgi:hypothetical protein
MLTPVPPCHPLRQTEDAALEAVDYLEQAWQKLPEVSYTCRTRFKGWTLVLPRHAAPKVAWLRH